MTGNSASVSVLALTGFLSGLGILIATGVVRAQSTGTSGGPSRSDMPLHEPATAATLPLTDAPAISLTAGRNERLLDFDIPALPLDSALDRYAAQSRRPVLFRSELVTGRMSSAVQGHFLPEAALNQLLKGTGLVAERDNEGEGGSAFVLMQADEHAAPAPYAGIDNLVSDRRYPGQVQSRIWQALCSTPRTAPGTYRALMRFQLSADGRVQGVRLLGSTGEPQRDVALMETLRAIQVPPPPLDMVQQPLTMLIVPGDHNGTLRCGRGAS